MKLKLSEDPRVWRKLTLLSAMPLAVLSTLFCWWKHAITPATWATTWIFLATVMICACMKPGWFRGYYRWSNRAGFWLSQIAGRLALIIFFFLVITPLGLVMRLFGKDALTLNRPRQADTYWIPSKPDGPLDRLF